MRRWLLFPAVALPAAAYFLIPPAQARPDAPKPATTLPIKQVVLFSAGVGYFGREGDINGDAKIDLSFPTRDINDLLKSMTLRDMGGGVVDAVTYDSQDPVERTLRSFAVDFTGNPSQAALLQQARGESVILGLTGGRTASGAIIGVEKQRLPNDKGVVEIDVLNLWTDAGLLGVSLRDVTNITFTNAALRDEIQRALAVLATSRDTRKKAVSLLFKGQGKRPVRVGYVVESPVWKTSYRLAIPGDGKPFLQGWAVVENPSDEDWTDVRMTLVSGRPVSFKMDLYQPLYVPRPTVEIERYASLRPQVYDGNMERPTPPTAEPVPARPMPAPAMAGRPGGRTLRGAEADRKPASQNSVILDRTTSEPLAADEAKPEMDLAKGIESVASAAQLGDFFQYAIKSPVTLPRQKSALLPIVQQEVDGERVSIYNPATHPKFPLLGLRFKNATGVSLMQGPVTVFDNGTYAGDARLPDLQPDERRLISYAIDLGTEVESVSKTLPQTVTAIKIVRGVVHVTVKQREERTYRAANRSAIDRTLLIEHPYRADYTLTSASKPDERTRDQYRFVSKLPAHGNAELVATEERSIVEFVGLSQGDSGQVRYILQQTALSAAAKAAIEEGLRWQARIAAKEREVNDTAQQLAAIERDQERLRQNLKTMPQTAVAYKRYLEKFDTQETQIERLQADAKRLNGELSKLRGEYETFLANLTVE